MLLPVQLNVQIPFFLREELVEAVYQRRSSQAAIVREALEKHLAKELAERARRETAEAGATE